MTDKKFYAVIMAGGGGTRLWPLSRRKRPKQLLKLIDNTSMFAMAVDRLRAILPVERILVVTVADQAADLQKDVPDIPMENYLIEPMPRGTASVVGLAAIRLQQIAPGATMAILTADHYIRNIPLFHQLLEAAYDTAQDDWLVTLGIHPTFPSTGYGYIQHGEIIQQHQALPVHRVLKFKQKPDLETAKTMLQSDDHNWNSGMFIWKVETILSEFARQMPELYQGLTAIAAAFGTPQERKVIEQVWHGLKPNTIDYGIMEKAHSVAVIPATDLGWDDIGSWESLFEVLPTDENGNIFIGCEPVTIDSDHSLIISENSGRKVAMIGMDDTIVVDTGDALLVCNRHDAQKVRDVVKLLGELENSKYL
ncbi:MAG: mannose-1-phosphate guanylyltransferase [Anaerolineaceae bacterium]